MPDEIAIQHGQRGERDLKEETPPRSTLARHPDAGCMQVGSQHVQAGTCTQLQVSRSQPPPGMPLTPKPVTRIRWLPTTTTRDSTHCGGRVLEEEESGGWPEDGERCGFHPFTLAVSLTFRKVGHKAVVRTGDEISRTPLLLSKRPYNTTTSVVTTRQELKDNGITSTSQRRRVQPDCWTKLCITLGGKVIGTYESWNHGKLEYWLWLNWSALSFQLLSFSDDNRVKIQTRNHEIITGPGPQNRCRVVVRNLIQCITSSRSVVFKFSTHTFLQCLE